MPRTAPCSTVSCDQAAERCCKGWTLHEFGKCLTLTPGPITSDVQGVHLRHDIFAGYKSLNKQKGPTPEHIVVQQGAALNANKTKVLEMGEKKRGLQSPLIGRQTAQDVAVRISGRDIPTDDEMRQAQNCENLVVRAEPETGNSSLFRGATSEDSGARPRVVPRESPVGNPSG